MFVLLMSYALEYVVKGLKTDILAGIIKSGSEIAIYYFLNIVDFCYRL